MFFIFWICQSQGLKWCWPQIWIGEWIGSLVALSWQETDKKCACLRGRTHRKSRWTKSAFNWRIGLLGVKGSLGRPGCERNWGSRWLFLFVYPSSAERPWASLTRCQGESVTLLAIKAWRLHMRPFHPQHRSLRLYCPHHFDNKAKWSLTQLVQNSLGHSTLIQGLGLPHSMSDHYLQSFSWRSLSQATNTERSYPTGFHSAKHS